MEIPAAAGSQLSLPLLSAGDPGETRAGGIPSPSSRLYLCHETLA